MTTQTFDLRAAVVEALAEALRTRVCSNPDCLTHPNAAGLADALATHPAVRAALTAAIASAGDGESLTWAQYGAHRSHAECIGTPESVAAAVLGALGGTGVAG